MQNQAHIPKLAFIYLNRGQAETVKQIRVMQIIQMQMSINKNRIQVRNDDTGRIQNQTFEKQSRDQTQLVKAKQKT